MANYSFLITVLVVLAAAVIGVTLRGIRLTNEQYDRLKKIVLKWPGILTLLGVIVNVFHPPFGEETITVVAAIGAFLSYILGVSDKNYVEGTVIHDVEEGINEDTDI